MTPVSITAADPKDLHRHWPLVRRGVGAVMRKLGKRRVDFIIPDVYAGLRNGSCTLHLVSRETRVLGFLISYPQLRPFSGKRELFCWIAWALPLRERLPGDRDPAAALEAIQFLKEHGKKLECDRIVVASSRRGLARYGFTPTITTWTLPIDATQNST